MKIEYNPADTWGLMGFEDDIIKLIKVLNTKDWTGDEKQLIESFFNWLEDEMEDAKEIIWGEDA